MVAAQRLSEGTLKIDKTPAESVKQRAFDAGGGVSACTGAETTGNG